MEKDTKVQRLRMTKKICRKLRKPLKIGEKVLALAKRINKKDAPGNLYNSTTENISFYNSEQVFAVKSNCKNSYSYLYWISKEEEKVLDKHFLRQEIYDLNDHID